MGQVEWGRAGRGPGREGRGWRAGQHTKRMEDRWGHQMRLGFGCCRQRGDLREGKCVGWKRQNKRQLKMSGSGKRGRAGE